MIFGDGRPGIAAVVMTTLAAATCLAKIACCCCFSSSVSSRAYPPSPSALTSMSTNFAPKDSTCSLVAERTS